MIKSAQNILRKKIISLVGISLFFFINIGSKELFRLLGSTEYLIEGTLLAILFLSVFLFNIPRLYSNVKTILVVTLVFLIFSSLTSTDPEYGIQKAFLGLFVPLLLFSFLVRKDYSQENLIAGYILMISVVCAIALLFKIRAGFFDRNVNFGLLGPITFGWLNGMAFLLTFLKGKKTKMDIAKSLFFFLMVIWTGSKGPLVAMIIISIFSFKKILSSKLSAKVFVLISFLVLFKVLSTYSEDIRAVKTVFDFLESPDDYAKGVGKGSIGVRQEYLNISYERFVENPILGVGFGGWNSNDFYLEHKYPHNLIFEILAELGFVGMLLFVLILINLKFRSIFGVLGVYGLISLLFSGDISYFRYALFPFLIAVYLSKKPPNHGLSKTDEFKKII